MLRTKASSFMTPRMAKDKHTMLMMGQNKPAQRLNSKPSIPKARVQANMPNKPCDTIPYTNTLACTLRFLYRNMAMNGMIKPMP